MRLSRRHGLGRRTGLALAASLALAGVSVGTPQPAGAQTVVKPIRTLIQGLPVANEVRTGYVRTAFHIWIDADHDGCNTRQEVLIAEAVVHPHIGAGCALTAGRWHSPYDGVNTTNPSTFDIDHTVPLAEAWDSGARLWNAKQREAYANDLADPRTLIAVSASSNRSKGDKDPADWLPSVGSYRCQYIVNWVAVKVRWKLKVDAREKLILADLANHCTNRTITVTIAAAVNAPPKPPPPPTSPGIPPNPGDSKNCSDFATYAQAKAWFDLYYPYYGDVAHLDADHDGIPCESLPGAP